MKIVKVTASHGVTVNLGDFQSARFDFSAEAEIDEGEDNLEGSAEIAGELQDWVAERVAEQVKEFDMTRLTFPKKAKK